MKDNEEIWMLSERAKELECMYAVDDILKNKQLTVTAAMRELINVIPMGFAYPSICKIRIMLNDTLYEAANYTDSFVIYNTPISIGTEPIGYIEIGYVIPYPKNNGTEYSILDNEIKMISAISWRISLLTLTAQRELSMLFDMLQRVDPEMLIRICDKFRIYLIDNIGDPVRESLGKIEIGGESAWGEINTPMKKSNAENPIEISKKLIALATMFLPNAVISELLNDWITNERAFSLIDFIDSKDTSVEEILVAVKRYTGTVSEKSKNPTTEKWLLAELCHRFLTNDDNLINLVIDNLQLSDFEKMLERIIASDKSIGNIGGKGAGLFIANQIISRAGNDDPLLADIKTPRTWYLAADQLVDFLRYNHLEELRAYKYNHVMHLRMTYDSVVKKIKNAKLPPYLIKLLRILLDEFEGVPIIVRSSSLLEDRLNSAFSGKYKSLFIANRGTKEKRLDELTDAILEVYSSMYNPDSICYRNERGLLNFTEQMGVLIQEVVGINLGPYFLPVFAGVAFSDNQLRWSSRIKREDGLVRMVMGLGTRAVDRVKEDYPILFSPLKPDFKINHTPEEISYYSMKYIDLINIEEQKFQTVPVSEFLKNYGNKLPLLDKIVSVYSDSMITDKNYYDIKTKEDELVVTFNGIIGKTDIAEKLARILKILSDKMQTAVDIEFAHDGKNLYLLQCRPQGLGIQKAPAPIPTHLPLQDILFTANKFITNGIVRDITHIIYVDSEGYNKLDSREDMLKVGKAVGMLGEILPKRQYILIGPGRWGSRGDITLGVHVTYSDIANTAALIEVARKKQSYVPELSFGTHFFQDLVEADIIYIPLYPDENENIFKEGFFMSADNLLQEILPQFSELSNVLKVIDINKNLFGKNLFIHLNSDLEQAVAFFANSEKNGRVVKDNYNIAESDEYNQHWRWRYYMAEQIAAETDMNYFGIKNIYIFGSTNTGKSQINSDIDLLVHFIGNDEQLNLLDIWFKGWGKSLAKINFLRTGYSSENLLDVHIITDNDIKNHDSFAMKINSITDPAVLLKSNI